MLSVINYIKIKSLPINSYVPTPKGKGHTACGDDPDQRWRRGDTFLCARYLMN